MIELDVAAARALTELYAGEPLEWQAGGVLVDFPAGRFHGFVVTPKTDDAYRAKWHIRIDKALRRAKLAP